MLEAFVGPCPQGMQTCHGPNHDPGDNRLSNIRWDTPKQNAADRTENGVWKAAHGERSGRAKRTEDDIEEMFRMRRRGLTHATIAHRFCASESCVSRALRGLEWAHVYKRMMQGERS